MAFNEKFTPFHLSAFQKFTIRLMANYKHPRAIICFHDSQNLCSFPSLRCFYFPNTWLNLSVN